MIGKQHCLPEKEVPISIAELPLKSTYRALMFYGLADGSTLTKDFSLNDLRKRTLIIKSFRIIPYTTSSVVDFYVTDSGATETWSETIPTSCRINRLFDSYSDGTQINFLLNGSPLSFFQRFTTVDVNGNGYPADLFLDNIYYKYPEKVQEIDLQIISNVFDDLAAGTTINPQVKVIVECYLI